MSQEEFILKNLLKELRKQGFNDRSAKSGAQDGLDHWRTCSHFAKSAWADCLAVAKKTAKRVAK